MGLTMAFYAYEKFKNERANLRKQARADGLAEGRNEGRNEGMAETIDAIRAKLEENPDVSPEELLESLVADLNARNGINGRS